MMVYYEGVQHILSTMLKENPNSENIKFSLYAVFRDSNLGISKIDILLTNRDTLEFEALAVTGEIISIPSYYDKPDIFFGYENLISSTFEEACNCYKSRHNSSLILLENKYLPDYDKEIGEMVEKLDRRVKIEINNERVV